MGAEMIMHPAARRRRLSLGGEYKLPFNGSFLTDVARPRYHRYQRGLWKEISARELGQAAAHLNPRLVAARWETHIWSYVTLRRAAERMTEVTGFVSGRRRWSKLAEWLRPGPPSR